MQRIVASAKQFSQTLLWHPSAALDRDPDHTCTLMTLHRSRTNMAAILKLDCFPEMRP
jgi:hypothetical protein